MLKQLKGDKKKKKNEETLSVAEPTELKRANLFNRPQQKDFFLLFIYLLFFFWRLGGSHSLSKNKKSLSPHQEGHLVL